jgi:hypothetical protein
LALKATLDQRSESYAQLEQRKVGAQKTKQAKAELDQADIAHYEANLAYNITIINLVYESIPAFKTDRRIQFEKMLRMVC